MIVQLIFVLLMASPSISQRGKKPRLPFPLQGDYKMTDIDKPAFRFEGVDYEELPENMQDQYKDCDADYLSCLRHEPHLTPVCAWDTREYSFPFYMYPYTRYNSICELDRDNCVAMEKAGKGRHGTHMSHRMVYFMGEGYQCEYAMRSLRDRSLELKNSQKIATTDISLYTN